jgi:ATP-dependent DNA helicase RecQ
VPVIGLTATATKSSGRYSENLEMSDATTFKASFNRPYYEVRTKTKKCRIRYHPFYKAAPREVGIIYCLSRKSGGDCPSVAS